MKNKIILIASIIVLTILSTKNISKAQIYDEVRGICKMHPNYQYEFEPERTPLHLALARIYISECGYDCEVDYMPILEVLKNRSSTGELEITKMMAYSPLSFNYHTNRRVRYIPYLNERGEKPLYWEIANPRLNWDNFRGRWFKTLRIARKLINGEQLVNPCSTRVDHWGARTNQMINQAYSNGNVPVYCAGTRNMFWRIDHHRRIELTRGSRNAITL